MERDGEAIHLSLTTLLYMCPSRQCFARSCGLGSNVGIMLSTVVSLHPVGACMKGITAGCRHARPHLSAGRTRGKCVGHSTLDDGI